MSWTDLFKDLGFGFQIGSEINSAYQAYANARLTQVQSNAQKIANEAQAVVAENNAQLAEWQATDALRRGEVEENRTRLATAQLKSTQRARMAANNIALDSETPLRVLTDTDLLGEIDAMTNRENAEREAWAYRVQADDQRNRAEILRHATVPIPDSTSGAVLGSLLGGAGRVASYWDAWRR